MLSIFRNLTLYCDIQSCALKLIVYDHSLHLRSLDILYFGCSVHFLDPEITLYGKNCHSGLFVMFFCTLSVVVTWIVFICSQKGFIFYWQRARPRGVSQFLWGTDATRWLFCPKAKVLLTKIHDSVFFNIERHTSTPCGFYFFKVLHLQAWSVSSVPTETVTDMPMFSTPLIKCETFRTKNKYNDATARLQVQNTKHSNLYDNFHFHALCNTFDPPDCGLSVILIYTKVS